VFGEIFNCNCRASFRSAVSSAFPAVRSGVSTGRRACHHGPAWGKPVPRPAKDGAETVQPGAGPDAGTARPTGAGVPIPAGMIGGWI